MKRLLTLTVILVISKTSLAQDTITNYRIFKKFKVDISIGYAFPRDNITNSGTNLIGGALFSIEPQFAIIDQLALGVRLEAAVTAHVNTNNNYSQGKSNGKANVSYLMTVDYYFTKTKFRPFIGAGAGVYSTANLDSTTVNSNSGNKIPYASDLGFMVCGGFEAGHLRFAAEYNFVSNNASYIGLKLGACFGGGRKKNNLPLK